MADLNVIREILENYEDMEFQGTELTPAQKTFRRLLQNTYFEELVKPDLHESISVKSFCGVVV